ncbi:MAG: hypothetical protein ACON42_04980 [Flavobacteriaceae bacterium]
MAIQDLYQYCSYRFISFLFRFLLILIPFWGSGQTSPTLAYIDYDVSQAVYAGAARSFYVGGEEDMLYGLSFSTDGTRMFVVGIADDRVVEYHLGTPWDVFSAVHAGFTAEYYVGGQESLPLAMAFSADGSRMYILGTSGDAVVEYHLGTPWDVSSATYPGLTDEFEVEDKEPNPQGIAFSADGSRMFIVGVMNDRVIEYHLGTPWDVSSAVHAGDTQDFYVGDREGNPRGLSFFPDGRKMFIIGNGGDDVVEYDLTIPWDVSTAVYAGTEEEFGVADEDNNPQSIFFSLETQQMFVLGGANKMVFTYDLNHHYTYDETSNGQGSVDSGDPLVISLFGDTFAPTDGDVLVVGADVIIDHVPPGLTPVLTIGNSQTIATLSFTGEATHHQSISGISSMTFQFTDSAFNSATAAGVENSGNTTAYTVNLTIDFNDNPYIVYGDYDVSTAVYSGTQLYVNPEERNPIGLAFSPDGSKLFVIGNNGDAVVEYNLSNAWDLSSASYGGVERHIGGQDSDPQGVAFSTDGLTMFIVGVTNDRVVQYDLSVPYDISTAMYSGVRFSVNGQEATPSDLTFSPDGSKMYIVGRIDDSAVEYTLTTPWDISTANYLGVELLVTGEEANPQGIAFHPSGLKMFVIGNLGRAVVEYELNTPWDLSSVSYSGLAEEFSVVAEENNPQSLTFSRDGLKMYVSGFQRDGVVEYDLQHIFPEAPANDGTIDHAAALPIYLMGDTFRPMDGGTLTIGMDVVIGGTIPTGLTPVVTISDSQTTANLTFTGEALNHQDIDDISQQITLQFMDSAFNSSSAAAVDHAGSPSPYAVNIQIDFRDNANTYFNPMRHGQYFLHGERKTIKSNDD